MANKKRLSRRVGSRAIAHVQATFNNIRITITDLKGDVLCFETAGSCGFQHTRKGTPFAAQRTAERVAEKARRLGIEEIEVKLKGPGSGREPAVTGLEGAGLSVKSIEDVTPLPHDGCRPAKRRRG
ncbi:MAG: 30S ribosomal protein S11 [Planctomycetes bacterium]|nr:30S ribosomal protein S11 [Planctomycetota bacterium]